ncbi:hypothetical protein NX059_000268 [Plenodomus lindquistii]|nr:hypothetical protein NX059_000268 [Plenodomus lindquistii]
MDDLEDQLDLRFHRGLEPDVYYRCPTLESLDGALRNELDKSASSLIPTAIVTEFIFAAASTITIPVTHQPNLDALIEPADFLQSITVEHALCRDVDNKETLKAQRTIARSIIDTIEDADGFKYKERSVSNTKSGDGLRLRYVCTDSPQSHIRAKSAKSHESEDSDVDAASNRGPPTYDCGGAVHVKFSIKREAINVVYKHNPIHTHSEEVEIVSLDPANNASNQPTAPNATNGTKKRKRKSMQEEPIALGSGYHDPDMDMSTSPEAPRSTKKSQRKSDASASGNTTRKTSTKKGRTQAASRKKAVQREPSPPPKLPRNRACIRCREKKIKCNEAKPACNQCQRGLWTCHYEAVGNPKPSKNGCINCKQRRRKCTEEKPFCSYCIRVDDDCEYAYGTYS